MVKSGSCRSRAAAKVAASGLAALWIVVGSLALADSAEDPVSTDGSAGAATAAAGAAGSARVEEAEDIRVRYEKERTVYEYRVEGEIVEMKIVPRIGPPYYLVPADGDRWERSDEPRIVVPSWKLFEW